MYTLHTKVPLYTISIVQVQYTLIIVVYISSNSIYYIDTYLPPLSGPGKRGAKSVFGHIFSSFADTRDNSLVSYRKIICGVIYVSYEVEVYVVYV